MNGSYVVKLGGKIKSCPMPFHAAHKLANALNRDNNRNDFEVCIAGETAA